MNKNIFLALALIAFSAVSYGQAKVAMGIKGGLNLSSIDRTATAGETYKSATGFHGGLFATIKIAKIGIQPEVLFSKQVTTQTDNSGDTDWNLQYVTIPVMIKWYMVKGLNLQVGPQFGMLTSAAQETAVGSTDIKSDLKSSDWSLGAGIGFDAPFKLNIEARYVIGLSDINNFAGASESIKNRTIQISLGYRFLDKGN